MAPFPTDATPVREASARRFARRPVQARLAAGRQLPPGRRERQLQHRLAQSAPRATNLVVAPRPGLRRRSPRSGRLSWTDAIALLWAAQGHGLDCVGGELAYEYRFSAGNLRPASQA